MITSDEFSKFMEDKQEIKGNLVLGIFCRDCDAQYELNKKAVALAVITKASIWDYIESVQNSTCSECAINKEE